MITKPRIKLPDQYGGTEAQYPSKLVARITFLSTKATKNTKKSPLVLLHGLLSEWFSLTVVTPRFAQWVVFRCSSEGR